MLELEMFGLLCVSVFALISADVLLAQDNFRVVLHNRAVGEEFHNRITLRCMNRTINADDGGALFWLNRTGPLDPSIAERSDIIHREWEEGVLVGIRFIITQELEGHYTCGRRITSGGSETNVVESNTISLVGETNNIILIPGIALLLLHTWYL